MDSAAHSSAAKTSVADKNSKVKISTKRDLFLSTYQPHQPWSLPDSVIYYILKNPSTSKVYEKLIQSCKYFFIKNPILVIRQLYIYFGSNELKTLFNGKEIDLKNINCKIWLTDNIFCDNNSKNVNNQYISTSILPKIFQSDVNKITFWHQNIAFNDLVILASKCEIINLPTVRILEQNGSDIAVEKIIEAFPLLKKFFFNVSGNAAATEIITSKTAKNLIKIPHFENLDQFELRTCIPECFDIDTFFSYIKKNKKTQISLQFVQNISEQYRDRLQDIVNEIIQAENRDYRPPYIYFIGIDLSSLQKLRYLLCL